MPRPHWPKIWSTTNPLAGVNKEIQTPGPVVFPNRAAVVRLAVAILADMYDEW